MKWEARTYVCDMTVRKVCPESDHEEAAKHT